MAPPARRVEALALLLLGCGGDPELATASGVSQKVRAETAASLCEKVDELDCEVEDCQKSIDKLSADLTASCELSLYELLACGADKGVACAPAADDSWVFDDSCREQWTDYQLCSDGRAACMPVEVSAEDSNEEITCSIDCGDVSLECAGLAEGPVSCTCEGGPRDGAVFDLSSCSFVAGGDVRRSCR